MPDPKHIAIGGICLPLDVEALEGLPVDPGGVIQFTFIYADICFAARYEAGDEAGRLKVVGDVGPLPFSAESPQARAGLMQIVTAATDHLGPVLHRLHGRISLIHESRVEHPVTAISLISAIARIVLPARPYLDLISVYVRPPMEPARPGLSPVRQEWRARRRA
jgi:hypothetical protein